MMNMDVKTPNIIEDTDRLLGTRRTKMKKKSWRNHITKLGYTAYITAKLNTVQLNKEKNCFHQIKSNTSCGKNSKSEHEKRSENSCQKKFQKNRPKKKSKRVKVPKVWYH